MHFKNILIFISLISYFPAFAGTTIFRILGVKDQVLMEQSLELPLETIGQFTHSILEEALKSKGLLKQYLGSNLGVKSINGLGSSLELLSDTEMNAYGWCYRVDGKISDLLANQYTLTGNEGVIEWFYAYAHFVKTEWTSMCIPADHIPPEE